jgi:hypothetical protein
MMTFSGNRGNLLWRKGAVDDREGRRFCLFQSSTEGFHTGQTRLGGSRKWGAGLEGVSSMEKVRSVD